jgi:hypothetical protein
MEEVVVRGNSYASCIKGKLIDHKDYPVGFVSEVAS